MKNKTLVIADGHHRYKTALKYQKNHDGLDSNEVMVTLVNSKTQECRLCQHTEL